MSQATILSRPRGSIARLVLSCLCLLPFAVAKAQTAQHEEKPVNACAKLSQDFESTRQNKRGALLASWEAKSPKHCRPLRHHLLAQQFFDQGEFEQALTEVEKALLLEGTLSEAALLRARTLLKLGEKSAAYEQCKELLFFEARGAAESGSGECEYILYSNLEELFPEQNSITAELRRLKKYLRGTELGWVALHEMRKLEGDQESELGQLLTPATNFVRANSDNSRYLSDFAEAALNSPEFLKVEKRRADLNAMLDEALKTGGSEELRLFSAELAMRTGDTKKFADSLKGIQSEKLPATLRPRFTRLESQLSQQQEEVKTEG